MMKTKMYLLAGALAFMCTGFISCNHDDPDPDADSGKIIFKFTHLVDGDTLEKRKLIYTNTAGNLYSVDELMYFISDVVLYKSDATTRLIDDWVDIYYVDINHPGTLTWNVFDKIPAGNYDSISFIFGITAAKNISMMYTNLPESAMMWPDILGGGYHYMMINGKWKTAGDTLKYFNFHLGIGQLYKNDIIEVDSIYAFVQNYFRVSLPGSAFVMEKDKSREIEIVMNVDSWFKTPHIYNHNTYGGDIMQKQAAMNIAKENGFDVFTIGDIQ